MSKEVDVGLRLAALYMNICMKCINVCIYVYTREIINKSFSP